MCPDHGGLVLIDYKLVNNKGTVQGMRVSWVPVGRALETTCLVQLTFVLMFQLAFALQYNIAEHVSIFEPFTETSPVWIHKHLQCCKLRFYSYV